MERDGFNAWCEAAHRLSSGCSISNARPDVVLVYKQHISDEESVMHVSCGNSQYTATVRNVGPGQNAIFHRG